jgi:hypothetical protein
MTTAPRTPADSVAAIIAWLSQAVAGRGLLGHLAPSVVVLIISRLREINQRIARIAARDRQGTYARRIVVAPHRNPQARPRRPNPLPKTVGWLLPLVPDAIGARSQLEYLFRDPAMAELMAAAPASLRRPLRSLCRMLGAAPPPILAPPILTPPVRPRPPKPVRPPRPTPPPPPEKPAWMRIGPDRKPWSITRSCGSRRRS